MINQQLAAKLVNASKIAKEYEDCHSRSSALNSQLKPPLRLPRVSEVLKYAFILFLVLWGIYAYKSWGRLRRYESALESWEEYAESEAGFVATLKHISETEAREIVDNYAIRPGEPPFYFPESSLELLLFIVIGGLLIFGLICGALYLYSNNLFKLENVIFGRANASRCAKNQQIAEQIEQVDRRQEELRRRYNGLGIPESYSSSAVLRKLSEYVKAGRAHSFSQAANLYEQDERHNQQLAQARRAQQQLADQLERQHRAQMRSDIWLQASIDDLKRK